jgi:flagellin-like hook-associated protein FlgL
MINRRYMRNLERTATKKNEAEGRITSQRKFNRASDAPVSAAKALKVRKALYDLSDYKDNLYTAKSIYEVAESSVMKCSSIIQETYEKLIYAANGTQSPTEDEILATSVEQLADEMVQQLNVIVADRRIFGGTNNDTRAFEIKDGTVYYNGTPVNHYQDPSMFKEGLASYSDIGIGMTADPDGRINSQSAIPVTFNGAEVMGCGLQDKRTILKLDSLEPGESYKLKFTVGDMWHTIDYTAVGDKSNPDQFAKDNAKGIQDTINKAFGSGETFLIDPLTGIVTTNIAGQPLVSLDSLKGDVEVLVGSFDELPQATGGDTQVPAADFQAGFVEGEEYTLSFGNGVSTSTIKFIAGADATATVQSINDALAAAGKDSSISFGINGGGNIEYTSDDDYEVDFTGKVGASIAKVEEVPVGYSDNVIQLLLDAAKCLRETHNKEEVAGYADAIFAAQTNVSLSIARIGNTEDFIDFNLDRLTNNEYSLDEIQQYLEAATIEEEATSWKLMESYFSAALQMGASVVPMSIFNFM